MHFSRLPLLFAVGILLVAGAAMVALRSGPGSDAGPAHAEQPTYVPDMVEKSTGIIYPYIQTDITARLSGTEEGEYGISGQPRFAAPDQVLLDATAQLSCPRDSERRSVLELSFTVCLPPGWTLDVQEKDPTTSEAVGPFVIVSSTEDIIGSDVQTFLAIGPRAAWLDSIPDCETPGRLDLEDIETNVCFFPDSAGRGQDSVSPFDDYAARSFVAFVPATGDGDFDIALFFMSVRMFGTDLPGMDDESFREALAILANLRFE